MEIVQQRGYARPMWNRFLRTAELEQLSASVPRRPDDPDYLDMGRPGELIPDQNKGSGPDRNHGSAHGRNNPASPDRNSSAGPAGINSPGKYSWESSSSSAASRPVMKRQRSAPPEPWRSDAGAELALKPEALNRTAQAIIAWAKERRIQRLRADRRIGLPEREQLSQWAAILDSRGIGEFNGVLAVLDSARVAAERSGGWWHWAYLTLQIQLAAERFQTDGIAPRPMFLLPHEEVEEDPDCDWAAAKSTIRTQIPETAFINWFAPTRQVERRGDALKVEVPDEPTRCYLVSEYERVTRGALSRFGINEVQYVVPGYERWRPE